ncbi:isoprenyl transferase [Thermopolyspora sp. NPDC052614]|uniref:isoprenyl transferase n=1 Tax=Thermopolyspora sp. NPDC052614 TaxID=3155682 RepID=UPI00343B683E
MGLRDLVYRLYERRLEAKLATAPIPKHVGVIVDGNRRWARAMGMQDVSRGHQKGADKISELLVWCREAGVEIVTVWLLSSENISRAKEELDPLIEIIENTVQRLVDGGWHINPMGALDLLPDHTARVLKDAKELTSHRPGLIVNVAVGYGGRREIADAVRSLLQEHASTGASIEELVEVLDVEHIAEHLYTRGQPDPDLLIRTSGEQRLSGFLLWQSAHSEFYFCEAYWPDFRRVDFLRALRSYAARHRRYGS